MEHPLRHLTVPFFLRGKLRGTVDTPCAGLQCLVDVGATQLDRILEGVSEKFYSWSKPHETRSVGLLLHTVLHQHVFSPNGEMFILISLDSAR